VAATVTPFQLPRQPGLRSRRPPKPDISTADAYKAPLKAKSITLARPAARISGRDCAAGLTEN
jgi:hypothetical protein